MCNTMKLAWLCALSATALAVTDARAATPNRGHDVRAGHPTPLGTCCKAPVSAALKKSLFAAGMTVSPQGVAFPAGHPNDVYFTGVKPLAPTPYKGYVMRPGGPLKLDFSSMFPELANVRFRFFFSGTTGGELLPLARAELVQFLRHHVGRSAKIEELGQGGQQIAMKVCRSKRRQTDCSVLKVRKLKDHVAVSKRAASLRSAATAMRQDLAMFAIADAVTRRALWLDKRGKPRPFVVQGKSTTPPKSPSAPPGRLARVARNLDEKLLAEGIVMQELVRFEANARLQGMFRDLRGPSGPMRDKAWREAPKHGLNRVRLLGFFDAFDSARKIGPDVIRLHAFARSCAEVSVVPTAKVFCDAVFAAFHVPDDFLQRVAALEQMYRDSAGAVIRFKRANFRQGTGNPGADGKPREVGLDYNHGRNVGWDPASGQFVLFDG